MVGAIAENSTGLDAPVAENRLVRVALASKGGNRLEAFVLIQTDDTTKSVAGALRDIGDVVAADDLRGPYDAIARVEVNGVAGRLEEHLANIKAIPGVDRAIVAPLIHDPQGVAGDEAA